MNIRVFDVGDGCHVQVGYRHWNRLIIDFGSQQRSNLTAIGRAHPFCREFDFVVSHYHSDHYNGLLNLKDDSLEIEHLYYPFIPLCPQKQSLEKIIYFLEYITLGSITGSPANDLVNLARKKNRSDFKHKSVKQGDTIFVDDEQMEVVWPPEIFNNKKVQSALSSGIGRIDKIISSNNELRELWEKFDRNVSQNQEFQIAKKTSIQKTEIRVDADILKSLSEETRKITNRFSICLLYKNEFLFLGDLESYEIGCCVRYLKKEYMFNHVRNLVAPHHGTHWSDELYNVFAHNVICTNGRKMVRHFKENFKKISNRCHSTYLNGKYEYESPNIYFNLIISFQNYRLTRR